MNNSDLIKQLFEIKDLKYKEFHRKLMPTIDKEKIISVTDGTKSGYSVNLISAVLEYTSLLNGKSLN